MGTVLPVTPADTPGIPLIGGTGGGNQPVSGSNVYLYATSSSGYGTASTSLLCGASTTIQCDSPSSNVKTDASGNGYVVTDANGGFSIADNYTCPGGALVYILALSGNPGLGGSVNNANIAYMAALGSCATLAANTGTAFINMNEVTTIASVYALAPFMTSATSVGTSSTNIVGLTNAFGTVYNLVNFATGTSPGVGQPVSGGKPAGLPSGMTVPVATINTLANILSSCTNSNPATSTNCASLFTATTVGGVAPTNTVQAALNIAQNPGLLNASTLFGLKSAQAAFSPTLTAAPQDWTLGITYSGPTATPVNNAAGYMISVDADGSVYAVENLANYLIKISPTGVASAIGNGITAPNVPLSGSYGVAVDLNGNLWVTNTTSGKEALTKLDANGKLLAQATPTSGGGSSNGGMAVGSSPALVAVDGNNNVWFTNLTTSLQTSVSKFGNNGVAISPAAGYFGTLTAKSDRVLGLAIDSSNNAWAEVQKGTHGNQVFGFKGTDGSQIAGTPYLAATGPINNGYAMAFDSAGNLWIPSRGSFAIVGLSSSTGALLSYEPAGGFTGGGQAAGATNAIAVDGNNNVWVANDTANNLSELITAGAGQGSFASPAGTGTAPTGGFQHGTTTGTRGVAIDGSGNVWSNPNSMILEVVGAAAPVVTPLALAVKNGKLGQRP